MPKRVYGGVELDQYKEPTFSREIRRLDKPEKVYLPIDKEQFSMRYRQRVHQNQPVCPGVYAPLEVRFTGLQTFAHLDTSRQFAVFETAYEDIEDAPLAPIGRPKREYDAISGEDVIEIAKKMAIIDEYDGQYLYQKLQRAKEAGVTVLYANAIDDEPYVSAGMGVLYKMPHEVGIGLEFACRAVGAKESYALVYANVGDLDTPLKGSLSGMKVKKLYGNYPVYKRQAVQYRSGQNEMIGVCALVHLYRACRDDIPQTTCFITVGGSCVANPCNMEVPIGTPVYDIMEKAGLIKNPQVITLGGPMTGVAITDLDVPVEATTRAVITYEENMGASLEHDDCIGCGRCVQVCPRRLMPYYIRKYVKAGKTEECMHLHAERCIECACCSFICPMGIDLVAYVQRYSQELKAIEEAQKSRAQEAPQPQNAGENTQTEEENSCS